MFYLKQFYALIWKAGIKGIAFLLLTIVLIAFNFTPTELRESILGQTETLESQTSFYVLTDANLSQEFLAAKLYKLASVKKVSFLGQEELQKRIEGVAQKMEVSDLDFAANLVGFRVMLAQKTEAEKVSLIKQYIQRQDPTASFTFSTIVEPEEAPGYLAKYSALIALAGIALSWILLAMLIIKPIQKKSYLLEKFQRKNWVALKIVGSGMFIFLALNVAGVYFIKDHYQTSVLTSSTLFLVFTIFMLRRNKWKA